MSIELKIKSKHLALEPAIIKKEEEKLKLRAKYYREKQEFGKANVLEYKLNSLVSHRKTIVRDEARATYLARAYIAGKNYSDIERNCKDYLPCYDRVSKMVYKYDMPNFSKEKIFSWYTT